jgi:nitrate reductase delta subunit
LSGGIADADEMTDQKTSERDSARRSRSTNARRGLGLRRTPAHIAALDRVRAWTRKRFGLADALPVVVAEVACGLPGCPPLETVVAFWTEDDRRHQFKLFKPVEEVVSDDLPFAWLKDALVSNGEDDCC